MEFSKFTKWQFKELGQKTVKKQPITLSVLITKEPANPHNRPVIIEHLTLPQTDQPLPLTKNPSQDHPSPLPLLLPLANGQL